MTQDQQEAATVELLALGGRLHGQRIAVPAGAQSWVDLLSAETYFRRDGVFPYVQVDPRNPRSVSLRKGWLIDLMIHESINQEPQVAAVWWKSLAMARLYEEFGREVDPREIIQNLPGGSGPDSPNGRAGQQHG